MIHNPFLHSDYMLITDMALHIEEGEKNRAKPQVSGKKGPPCCEEGSLEGRAGRKWIKKMFWM